MKPRQILLRLSVALGIVAYTAGFYASRLPSLESVSGQTWRRIGYVGHYLLVPEALLEQWFGSPPQCSLADRLPVALLAVAILACAAGVGWLVLHACRADRQLTVLETWVFSTAVGINVLSTYTLSIGLLGWLGSRWGLVVPALIAMVAGGRWWQLRGRRLLGRATAQVAPADRRASRQLAPPDWPRSRHWLWLAAPFVLVVLLGGMLPPAEFDVREYHLQAPKEFFHEGRIGFLPHNVYGNMPLGSEMLCLLAMVLAGDWWLGALAGKTVVAAMTPLCALGLLAAGSRFFTAGAGVAAAVIYLSVPWIVQVSTTGLVEGASACFLLLSGYAVWLWQEGTQTARWAERAQDPVGAVKRTQEEAPRRTPPGLSPTPPTWPFLGLAGYLAGSAVSCKYPAVIFVVVPLAVWILLAHVPGRLRAAWRPLGVFGLAALVGCGLWFGKNWALTGNPTYPLLARILDGKTRTPEKDRQWNRVHLPNDFSAGRLGSDLAAVAIRSEWLSPLVMPLAALALIGRQHRRRAVALIGWFAYTLAAWWLLTHRIDRFWVPGLSILSLAAGVGACWTAERWFRRLLIPVLGVAGLGYCFIVASSGPGGYNRYFVPLAQLRSAPERVDPWHRYFNAHVKEGRVLMVGEAQVFDVEVPILYNTCFDDSIFEQLVKGRTAQQAANALAERGVSLVYVHWGEIARYRQSGYGFSEFVQPEVLDWLVREGVLDPLPAIEGHSGRAYWVRGAADAKPQAAPEP